VAKPPANSDAAISRPIAAGDNPAACPTIKRTGNNAAIHGEHMLQAVSHVGRDAEILIFWPLR